jgi:hypothetical protein
MKDVTGVNGLSKQMVKQAATICAWRGFTTGSLLYQVSRGLPQRRRYQKAVSERCALSIGRPGIENGKFSLHRNSQVRVIKVAWIEPFLYTTHRSRRSGSGSEFLFLAARTPFEVFDAFCDIPVEEISGLEIPNGLPIIFDLQSK